MCVMDMYHLILVPNVPVRVRLQDLIFTYMRADQRTRILKDWKLDAVTRIGYIVVL